MSIFSATFDTVTLLIATTTILLFIVVVFTIFTLKRKWLSSRKTSNPNYDVFNSDSIDRKYETLQRNTADTVGIDTTAEYIEIPAITSDYINYNEN